MAQLTNQWASYSTAVWDFGATKVTYYLEAKYSTQSQTNNNTTIQTRLRAELNYGYGSGYGYNFTCSYAPTVSGSNEWYLASEVITSGETTIPHNQDGTKTITLNATASVNGLGKSSTLTATVDLPPIQRASSPIDYVMNVSNDGNTITLTPTFTKYVSSFYQTLSVAVKVNETTLETLFTLNGVNSGTTYTLDSTQRQDIYNAIGTNTSKTFRYTLYTYTSNGGSLVGNYGSQRVTTLPDYTISTTISEMVDTVSDYDTYKPSGHTNDTFIANLSKPRFTLTTTSSTGSFYGRTVSYKLNNTVITSPYTENNYTGQTFTFNATDDRKTASVTASFTNIPYFKPSLTTSIRRTSPTGSTANISVSGNLYDGTGLTNLATPTLTFKYTESGGSEQEITIPLTISGNNFTGSATLTGLNYQKSMAWSSILTDRIGVTTNNGNTLPQGLPVYHAYRKNDENYFNVIGNLLINGVRLNTYKLDTEIVIGYDADNNKPIYRYGHYISSLPNNAVNTYDIGLRNVDQVFHCYGTCEDGYELNAVRPRGITSSIGVWYTTSNNRVNIETGVDRSNRSATVWVEYTKTTD